MKKRITTCLLACLLSFVAYAQPHAQKGFFAELTAAYSNIGYHNNFAVISPSVGYQFNDRWLAGMRVGFETRDHAYIIYTPFARFNYLSKPKWVLFTEAQINIANRNMDGAQAGYSEIGLGLGASYTLSRHVKIVGRYLFVGYSEREERKNAYAGNKDFLLDANVGRLQLGVQVLF